MHGAPRGAGPRTVSAQVNSGQEVDKVGVGPQVTLDEVGSLPLVLDPATAGRLLGMSRSAAYRHLKAGTFPAPAYRVGRSWHIPTAGILTHLGLDQPSTCRCGARRDQPGDDR